MKSGDRIWFAEEKRPYAVRAADARYAVCTKPFNPKRTVLYTVVDSVEQIRGTENLIFCAGAETDQQCADMLLRITSGKTEISRRNRIPLRIARRSASTAARCEPIPGPSRL